VNEALTRDSISEMVRAVVAGSMALPPGQVALTSRLINELGADSLDLLDIIFTLERKFSVKLRDTDLSRLTRADIPHGDLVDGRYISPQDVERFAEWLPALKTAVDARQVVPEALFSHVTVESLVILVEKKLAEGVRQQQAI
jgi:acyl carrier protein